MAGVVGHGDASARLASFQAETKRFRVPWQAERGCATLQVG
ncbi:hypothetical protein DLM_2497 [Aquitalea magnusonii]|uniref:Uncharacterized protein n=1 Tax=Aquitalea magnusonii TaxID=332411 RepID=A0A3G9GFF5_9NEIS|nr:hypothetical protein DLM_2497 [Aquitalea magnusonii]